MTHKDTHRTRGMRTTQGSVIFRDQVPSQDDLVIERLRAAGVVTTGISPAPTRINGPQRDELRATTSSATTSSATTPATALSAGRR
jgi:Asp-tRNA(Asn)/Glu-tRNA(Gln) amidotransferase A subunit family amidase